MATQILLVDDNDLLAEAPVDFLTSVGYEVHWTLNAQCALGHFVTTLLRWAILDVRLPGLDGITLYRELRKRCALPIWLMTDADRDEVRRRRWLAGAAVTLQTGTELVHAIAQLLEETMVCLRQPLTTIVHHGEQ